MFNNSTIYRAGNCGRGSLGGFFHMGNDHATVYGISNNHVIANLNNCKRGDDIFNASNNVIGDLEYWVTLNQNATNYIDTALFRYNSDAPQWRMPVNLPKPLGFIDSRLYGKVYMMLENGNVNTGFISNSYINYLIEFSLCGNNFRFSYLIEITPYGNYPFSVPGESGSIIMSSNHCIVGLLMGTNADKTRSYAVPFINGILNYFPLTIA